MLLFYVIAVCRKLHNAYCRVGRLGNPFDKLADQGTNNGNSYHSQLSTNVFQCSSNLETFLNSGRKASLTQLWTPLLEQLLGIMIIKPRQFNHLARPGGEHAVPTTHRWYCSRLTNADASSTNSVDLRPWTSIVVLCHVPWVHDKIEVILISSSLAI